MGLLVLIFALLPLALFIIVALVAFRIYKRFEQRATERLALERMRNEQMQQQVTEMKLRLNRIQAVLEDI